MPSLAIFLCILLVSPSQIRSQQQDAVASFCEKALYKDVCESIVESSLSKDKKSLIAKGLNLALSSISEMGKRFAVTKDPAAKKAIEDCTDMYGEATDLIQKSMHALRIGGFNDVNTWISSAMTSSDTCEDAFKETNYKSPVTDINKQFNQYCSSVLAFTIHP